MKLAFEGRLAVLACLLTAASASPLAAPKVATFSTSIYYSPPGQPTCRVASPFKDSRSFHAYCANSQSPSATKSVGGTSLDSTVTSGPSTQQPPSNSTPVQTSSVSRSPVMSSSSSVSSRLSSSTPPSNLLSSSSTLEDDDEPYGQAPSTGGNSLPTTTTTQQRRSSSTSSVLTGSTSSTSSSSLSSPSDFTTPSEVTSSSTSQPSTPSTRPEGSSKGSADTSVSYNMTTTVFTHTTVKTITNSVGITQKTTLYKPVTSIQTKTSCPPETKTVPEELTKTTTVSYTTTGTPITQIVTYIDSTSTTTVCNHATQGGGPPLAEASGGPPWGTGLPPWGYYGPPPSSWFNGGGGYPTGAPNGAPPSAAANESSTTGEGAPQPSKRWGQAAACSSVPTVVPVVVARSLGGKLKRSFRELDKRSDLHEEKRDLPCVRWNTEHDCIDGKSRSHGSVSKTLLESSTPTPSTNTHERRRFTDPFAPPGIDPFHPHVGTGNPCVVGKCKMRSHEKRDVACQANTQGDCIDRASILRVPHIKSKTSQQHFTSVPSVPLGQPTPLAKAKRSVAASQEAAEECEERSPALAKRCTNGVCETDVYCVDFHHISEAPSSWNWGATRLPCGEVCIDDVVYEKSYVDENCACAGNA